MPLPIKREIPETWSLDLPSSDEMRHELLVNAFDMMNHLLDSFFAALTLFDFALERIKVGDKEQNVYRHWQFIAARDGAITIYNFQSALGSVTQTLNKSQYFAAKFDRAALRSVRKKFEAWFPDAADVRHSVGHASDKFENEKEHVKNGYSGVLDIPGLDLEAVTNFILTDHLHDRTLYNTLDTKIVQYTIDQSAFEHLKEVRDEVFDLFDSFIAQEKKQKG